MRMAAISDSNAMSVSARGFVPPYIGAEGASSVPAGERQEEHEQAHMQLGCLTAYILAATAIVPTSSLASAGSSERPPPLIRDLQDSSPLPYCKSLASSSPVESIDSKTPQVEIRTRKSASDVFRRLFKSRGEDRDRYFDLLCASGDPSGGLQSAMADYDRLGNQSRLALAASVLSHMGPMALDPLRALFRSGRQEASHFVSALLGLEGVPQESKIEILRKLAESPDMECRLAASDALSSLTH